MTFTPIAPIAPEILVDEEYLDAMDMLDDDYETTSSVEDQYSWERYSTGDQWEEDNFVSMADNYELPSLADGVNNTYGTYFDYNDFEYLQGA